MKFVTLAELAGTIRKNIYKIPHDVDFIIGIPRSGIIAASIVSEFLNAPLIDIDSFIFGAKPTGGRRSRFHVKTENTKPKVLVMDDTIFKGGSMRSARQKLEPFCEQYEFIYSVAYLEGPCNDVDIWLEDLRPFTENYLTIVIYEWNIFHQNPRIMSACIYDIDGVLCIDPPDERNKDAYVEYIKNAIPLFTPTVPIGEIVSYRLSKYDGITRDWLQRHHIGFKRLTTFAAQSWEERANSGISSVKFKSDIYSMREWARLFVESSEKQAREIHERTGKPVYCVENNKMYD